MFGIILTIKANSCYSDDESIVWLFCFHFMEIMSGKNKMFYIGHLHRHWLFKWDPILLLLGIPSENFKWFGVRYELFHLLGFEF